jgi:hypothetical protein
MATRPARVACGVALLALVASRVRQAHPEILVGHDAKNRLVARFDATRPFPLEPSRLIGIDGYAAGMPGLNTLFTEKTGDDLLQLDAAADVEFVLLRADPGIAVLNDHGSAPMRVGETFSLGHAPFDSHPVWNIRRGEPGRRYELQLRLRDRAGRYADSEPLAPAFTPDDSTELFACPMKCKGGSTYPQSGKCPVCGMRLKRLSGRSYAVRVEQDGALAGAPLPAGKEVTLRFHLAAPDGGAVQELEVVHEKLIHLLLVSDDLAWFGHEHPELQQDGTFTLRTTFPHGGGFTLFHDFTPRRDGMQVVPVELEVAGAAPPAVALVPDADGTRLVDGCAIRFTAPAPIRSLFNLSLTAHVTRDGKPVTDLEPYLGALGHLIVVSEDRSRFVHSHPLGAAPTAGAPAGPDVTFSALFPAPGRYKAWVQLQRGGRVLTAPFVFDVVPP